MKDYQVTVSVEGGFPVFEFFTKAHDFQEALARVQKDWDSNNTANSASVLGYDVRILKHGAIL